MTIPAAQQIAVPATWMRGGTSKALFFLAKDLPPPGPDRDRVIKRIMGCPHILQIDGVGGGRGNTSKIAIIDISARDDADVDYLFAQVGIGEDMIDYRATCGNISAAVGPFAILKGLVHVTEPSCQIRIYNSNIDDLLMQQVETVDGQARLDGSFLNAGVAGTGSEVFTDFSRAVGRRTGKMLPSGRPRDWLHLRDGRRIEATLLDVGNPVAYVEAQALEVSGSEHPDDLLANVALMAAIDDIREQAADRMGLRGIFTVRVGLIAPPTSYHGGSGEPIEASDMDVCGRFFALDYCAPNYPGSASMSTGAAARIPHSIVHQAMPAKARRNGMLRIGHPNGVMHVLAEAEPGKGKSDMIIRKLGFGRTARALMDGVVYVPVNDWSAGGEAPASAS